MESCCSSRIYHCASNRSIEPQSGRLGVPSSNLGAPTKNPSRNNARSPIRIYLQADRLQTVCKFVRLPFTVSKYVGSLAASIVVRLLMTL